MTSKNFSPRIAFVIALAFAGVTCAQTAPPPAPAGACTNCGVVRSVQLVEKKGDASGVGAIAGGVLGGVVGHQFGSGRGNTAMTIGGAAAGAYAGNEVEKNRNKKSYWRVSVKMDDGKTRTFTYANKPDYREGDRVKTLNSGRRLALLAN